jgi:hypothetical protein
MIFTILLIHCLKPDCNKPKALSILINLEKSHFSLSSKHYFRAVSHMKNAVPLKCRPTPNRHIDNINKKRKRKVKLIESKDLVLASPFEMAFSFSFRKIFFHSLC